MKSFLYLLVFLAALPAIGQSNTGELRLSVGDPSGRAVETQVELVCEANQYHSAFTTDDAGNLDARRLPYGIYLVRIEAKSFAPVSESVAIHSALPVNLTIQLKLAPVSQAVTVDASGTLAGSLIDTYRAGSVNQMGRETIQNRVTALPGRSIQDLVDSEPGWLLEGNAVLHPRGSEYQTQFVIDGIPLTDNRSPGFGTSIDANDIQSMSVYTAGIPAQYGGSLGGVVVVNTIQNEQPGFHGAFTLLGGAYSTGGTETQDEYAWGKNALGFDAAGNMTDHYLNTPAAENYTNRGTTGEFSLNYQRQLAAKDHLTLMASHELARYEIPNELVQQNGGYVPDGSNTDGCSGPDPAADNCVYIPGGQLQTSDNFETMGILFWEHIFSPKTMGALRGMARDASLDFRSNPASWPVNVTQHNDFKNIYFNGSMTADRHHQEWTAGIETDSKFLHEDLSYVIPDCADPNDPQCPLNVGVIDAAATSFAFAGSRPALEQAAYVEDSIQLGPWSIAAGLRWDHYQLMVNKNAVSPRVAVARYFPTVGVKVHSSWDHVFQTPSFENIILSSSPQAQALDTSVPVVQLPVEPGHGNYYELGAAKAFFGKLRADGNMYRRDVTNAADDSQIFSTGISFPIAFSKAVIYGAEGKLEVQQWGRFSGFASYSYMVGNIWNPVTGGLFLGGDAINAADRVSGHFPATQDQRNSVRDRIRVQITSRLWVGIGSEYNSGLPFDANQTVQQDVSEYGHAVVNRLNFDRGRIRPSLTENASVSAGLYRHEKVSVRLQADGENLNNTLDVVDFGGLFSGNAIGPGRSTMLRLTTEF